MEALGHLVPGGLSTAQLRQLSVEEPEKGTSVSSANTFDVYKLSMSKDMTVLRRQYDRLKHDFKSKQERVDALEKDLDNLRSLNTRDDKSYHGSSHSKESQFRRSTLVTADYGTGEKPDDMTNLDTLRSLILVQRSKLRQVEDRVQQVRMEKWQVIEMLKKTREQMAADRREQVTLQTQLGEAEKLVAQMEGVRHLEAGRRVTLGGMQVSNRMVIERERQVWAKTLELRTSFLRQEERETRERLKGYLEHLKSMKALK